MEIICPARRTGNCGGRRQQAPNEEAPTPPFRSGSRAKDNVTERGPRSEPHFHVVGHQPQIHRGDGGAIICMWHSAIDSGSAPMPTGLRIRDSRSGVSRIRWSMLCAR
jgi:hypothetical protein